MHFRQWRVTLIVNEGLEEYSPLWSSRVMSPADSQRVAVGGITTVSEPHQWVGIHLCQHAPVHQLQAHPIPCKRGHQRMRIQVSVLASGPLMPEPFHEA